MLKPTYRTVKQPPGSKICAACAEIDQIQGTNPLPTDDLAAAATYVAGELKRSVAEGFNFNAVELGLLAGQLAAALAARGRA